MTDIQLLVLGPLEARCDGTPLPLLGAREQKVLAALALDAGRALTLSHLVDVVWDDDPPATARLQVQNVVSRLRQVWTKAGLPHAVVITEPRGYRLRADLLTVDAGTFSAHLDEAERAENRGDLPAAAASCRAALALWRGEALAGLDGRLLGTAAAVWNQRRHNTLERYLDLQTRLGRYAAVVPELTAAVAEHPYRERLAALLMRALYGSGRQAEALSAFDALRRRLADELGLDPGPEITHLRHQILNADPALRPPATSRNYLPYDVGDFTGRTEELEQLLTSTANRTVAVDGMGGVGKTAFAVHAAHRLAPRFPDGQFFVDLHGFTPGREPMTPAAALNTLLRAAGVPPEHLPEDADQRAGMWRAQLAGRSALVVLDNAADAAQVRPLLPGAPGCLVLITSRRRLHSLDGARHLSLDVLPDEEGLTLFTQVAGAGHEAAAEVVALCGNLPLAIRIAAARLRSRPQWTAGRLLTLLRAEHGRLAELSIDDRNVAASFALSYRDLEPGLQRLFRLLGLHPGTDVDVHAAAALAGAPVARTSALLDALLDAHLLAQRAPDRYTFHDLLRAYARSVAEPEDAALTRLYDHYLYSAAAAMDVLVPHEKFRRPVLEARRNFADAGRAAGWLTAERANLLAVAAHAPAHAVPLSAILWRFLDSGAHYADGQALHTHALNAATDASGRAGALRALGITAFRLGQYAQALETYEQALRLHQQLTDRLGEAAAHGGLAMTLTTIERHGQALDHCRQALAIYQDLGHRPGEGTQRSNLGALLCRLGRHAEALPHAEQAAAIARQIGDRSGESLSLGVIGVAHGGLGRHETALDHLQRALVMLRELGHLPDQAVTLIEIGIVHARAGRPAEALEHHRLALTIATDTGESRERAIALDEIAHLLAGQGDTVGARQHWREALELYGGLDLPSADHARAHLAGEALCPRCRLYNVDQTYIHGRRRSK
ncbi:BTAD domain-containing putative transcriptional regulator [Nonomuraea sp. NPDC050556]|uniref:AfsR/SARP family transcriptional regulator n=1 Tax=Nonomuraea sp. NPDC050556 TaxID=3364369 RepID=UPI0037BA19E7